MRIEAASELALTAADAKQTNCSANVATFRPASRLFKL